MKEKENEIFLSIENIKNEEKKNRKSTFLWVEIIGKNSIELKFGSV